MMNARGLLLPGAPLPWGNTECRSPCPPYVQGQPSPPPRPQPRGRQVGGGGPLPDTLSFPPGGAPGGSRRACECVCVCVRVEYVLMGLCACVGRESPCLCTEGWSAGHVCERGGRGRAHRRQRRVCAPAGEACVRRPPRRCRAGAPRPQPWPAGPREGAMPSRGSCTRHPGSSM
jgi:hypothetical protein